MEFILFFSSLPQKKEEETLPTLQHISKPPQAKAQTKGLYKSCNFAYAPVLNCYF